MRLQRRSRWWIPIAVSAALSSVVALPASAQPNLTHAKTQVQQGDQAHAILMGDSYASGEGGRWEGNGPNAIDRGVLPTYGSTWDYPVTPPGNAGGCHRSDVAVIYPYEKLELLDLARNKVNIACGGAEIKHVLTESWKGEKPQIDQLKEKLNPGIKYVVLSVGGNDADVSGVAEACIKKFAVWKQIIGPTPIGRSEGEKYQDYLKGLKESDKNQVCSANPKLSGLENKLENVYETLVKEAITPLAPDAQLVVLNYPSPLPADDTKLRGPYEQDLLSRWQDGGCPFFDKDFAKFAGISKDINGKIEHAVAAAAKDSKLPIHLLDVAKMYAGHEICAAGITQDQEWMRQVPVDQLAQPGLASEALHPNALGQRMEGACVQKFLDQLNSRTTKSASEHGVCQDNADVQMNTTQ